MSNKKRNRRANLSSLGLSPASDNRVTASEATGAIQTAQSGWVVYLKTHWWAVGIIAVLALGALGASFKYLEDDAKRQQAEAKTLTADLKNSSLLNKINPFISAPLPTSTPTLSKEYVYAGSRLLAVEDANATAAPPADLAVWRPSSGVWYVMGGQGSQQTFYQFGQNLDITVPGDYDGDGKTDFSVFRPSDNYWYVVRSSDNSPDYFQYGLAGDTPAQADFDGDGRTDKTVYRNESGLGKWYIWRSATGDSFGQQFGLSTDKPAPADYDGDGKADIAVWRSGNPAIFYFLPSSGGPPQSQVLGQSGDIPVCGDYDGDGRADFAVRRGADWIILNSSNGQTQTITWQQAGDVAVPNDYDGDGKLDIAVWRPTGTNLGHWYIRQSSLGGQLRDVLWGESGDIPVPAFYRR